jgi:two-component system CheB/CheR fusion protein
LPHSTKYVADPRPLKVLIVDDDVDGAESLGCRLEALGCVTAVAFDGRQALERLFAFRPHLAFIDYEMPGMTGGDVVRTLRNSRPGLIARLVCLTGRTQPEDRLACLEAGFDDFIAKPMSPETLARVLGAVRSRL